MSCYDYQNHLKTLKLSVFIDVNLLLHCLHPYDIILLLQGTLDKGDKSCKQLVWKTHVKKH